MVLHAQTKNISREVTLDEYTNELWASRFEDPEINEQENEEEDYALKTFQLPLRMKTNKTKKGSVHLKGYRFRVDKKSAKEARSKEKTKRFFHKKDTKGSEDEVVATLIEEQEEIDRQWDAFCYYHYYYDRIND